MSADQVTPSNFDPNQRLDAFPPLANSYRLDELLAEHFAFAPKTFTRHLFNLINDAVFDSIDSVEEAVRSSFNSDLTYPSQDDISKSINSLETLLCSATDRHFDLVELWMHRNIFAFPSKYSEGLLDHFKFEHMKLWDHLFEDDKFLGHQTSSKEPDWEKIKIEESKTWDDLEKAKQDYLQVTDDHASLLAVSKALDRKLAGLKAVSTQLDVITSGAPRVYDPDTKKPLGLSSQATKLAEYFDRLSELKKRQRNIATSPSITNLDANQSDANSQDPSATLRYENLVNEFAMSKIDDLAAELGEKGGPNTEVDECLMEVMTHIAGKGKATDTKTVSSHLPL
ncbi:hypothetical protein DFH28DRAFT_1081996 [Melampsora americana]|nr:hypothetical protein DFH28DRAFT_1081996 [Melampsora americana]